MTRQPQGAGALQVSADREAGNAPASGWSFFLAVLRTRPQFALGYGIVVLIVLLAIFAPLIAPFDPRQANPAAFLQKPGWPYLMGTDATGLDVFSRVIYAPRIDLTIALAGTVVSALAGSILGAIAGYYETKRGLGRMVAGFIMRSSDVVQAFPVFVFAIAVVAVLGQSLQSIVLAVAFVNAPIYLRLMRSQVLSVRRLRYVEAAYIAGTSDLGILARHVIPNAMAPVLAQLSVNIGWSILLTAGLSFIGAGVEAPTPEWGSMIAMGYQNIITGHWWPSIFPGLALALTIFGFSLVGSSVEVLADPVRRGRLAGEIRSKRVRKTAATARA
ncbi:MAG: ABC transporter permease [Rhizobiales bacterium]|nr:ABC transporter permease [Hyphomicrobiales bacterium]